MTCRHGGEHRAVFVYQIGINRYWQSNEEGDILFMGSSVRTLRSKIHG